MHNRVQWSAVALCLCLFIFGTTAVADGMMLQSQAPSPNESGAVEPVVDLAPLPGACSQLPSGNAAIDPAEDGWISVYLCPASGRSGRKECRDLGPGSARIELPFSFRLYGRSYDTIYVRDDGSIAFDPATPRGLREFGSAGAILAPLQVDPAAAATLDGVWFRPSGDQQVEILWKTVGFGPDGMATNQFVQTILTPNGVEASGDANACFCYAGAAAGGQPAQIGIGGADGQRLDLTAALLPDAAQADRSGMCLDTRGVGGSGIIVDGFPEGGEVTVECSDKEGEGGQGGPGEEELLVTPPLDLFIEFFSVFEQRLDVFVDDLDNASARGLLIDSQGGFSAFAYFFWQPGPDDTGSYDVEIFVSPEVVPSGIQAVATDAQGNHYPVQLQRVEPNPATTERGEIPEFGETFLLTINVVCPDCSLDLSVDPTNTVASGTATDLASGIFDVSLLPGSFNLSLATDPFVPGDFQVDFQITQANALLPGLGRVAALNGVGGTCEGIVLLGSFDPFGSVSPTPDPDVTVDITPPDDDVAEICCVETDPAAPDFGDETCVPVVPPGDPVAIDLILSDGIGTKDICCIFLDDGGNASPPVCDQIELVDPMLEIACPLDVTLECPAADLSPAVTGTAVATAGADVDFADSTVPGCAQTSTTTRTWTATDGVSEPASCDQAIEVVDTTDPTIDIPNPNPTFDCTEPGGIPGNHPVVMKWLDEASAADSCGAATLSDSLPPFLPLGSTASTLDALDECGNDANAPVLLTVIDSTAPDGGISFPEDGTCFGVDDRPVMVTASFSDLCDDDVDVVLDPAGPFDVHGDYTVLATATDDAGMTATDSVFFTIDVIPPVVTVDESTLENIPMFGTPIGDLISTSDDDAASGGVVRELFRIEDCILLDGDTFGDGDGLLTDENANITVDEAREILADCGIFSAKKRVLTVEAIDCAGNVGGYAVFLGGISDPLDTEPDNDDGPSHLQENR